MPEHLIRLRGPWELIDPQAPESQPSRLALPAERLPSTGGPLLLRRRFGRPARIDGRPPCSLRAEAVPGLLRIRLNGVDLPRPDAGQGGAAGAFEAAIGPLLRVRNLLELEVDPGPASRTGAGLPWGSIALAFDDEAPPLG